MEPAVGALNCTAPAKSKSFNVLSAGAFHVQPTLLCSVVLSVSKSALEYAVGLGIPKDLHFLPHLGHSWKQWAELRPDGAGK